MKRLATVASLVATLTASLAASATRLPATTRLILPPCSDLPFDSRKLSDLLDLELRAIGVEYTTTANGGDMERETAAIVVIGSSACGPAASSIDLELSAGASRPRASRSMPIGDIPPELRPRALAIDIVELIRAEWPNLSPLPSTATPEVSPESLLPPPLPDPAFSVPASPGPDRASDGDSTHRGLGIEPAVTLWSFPSRSTALIGPTASLSLEWSSVRASAGVQAVFGQTTVSTGTIDVRWASAYVGVGLTGHGAFRGIVEPRLYAGHGWATGTPADAARTEGSDASGFVFATTLAGGLRSAISSGLDAIADVEIGYAWHGVSFQADAERAAGLSRLVVGTRIGVSFAP